MTAVVVATIEDVAELKAEIAELRRLVEKLGGGAIPREYLTPLEVAKAFRIGRGRVTAALRSGRLKATRAAGKGQGGIVWQIDPADARQWFERFERGRSNQ